MTLLLKTITRNSLVALVSKFFVKLISFVFTILIARTLGESEFGRYALIWSYVTIFATCSDFGLGMYTIRELAKGQANSKYLAENIIVFRLMLALATVLLIGLTSFFIGYTPQMFWHIVLASTTLFIYAVQDPLDSILQANERVDWSSLLRIVGQFIFIGLGAIFLLLGGGITGLIAASLCNTFISAVLSWYLVQKYLGGLEWHIEPKIWFTLLKAALPFGIIGLALNWSQELDTVMLSFFWPDEVIGWYNAAYNLILGMVIISNSFNVALYPTMSKENSRNTIGLHRLYKRIFKYLFMASFPLAVGFFMLSRPIILTFYGEAFAPAILPLSILAWLLPMVFVSEFLRYTALVVGQEKKAATAILLASLVNMILNLLFIPRYGLLAASVTTLITEAFLVSLYLWQLRVEISIISMGSVVWKPALAASLMAVILLLFSFMPFILAIILAGSTYIGILFLLGDLGAEETGILRELFTRHVPVVSNQ